MEHMLLDLPMTRTPLASPVQLQYAAGIIANLDSVLQQYIDSHSLQPLRLVLTGPPAVGKSALALRSASSSDSPDQSQFTRCCVQLTISRAPTRCA